ncbi:MAG: tetratricopeptide repeat protein [Pyrinomonadaceae bacterium]
MKRCPECRRDYYDDTLSFCLEDGTQLVQGSVPAGQALSNEPLTAILSEPGAVATGFRGGEDETRAQILTTDQTAILRTGAEAEPGKSLGERSEKHSLFPHRTVKPLMIIGIAVVLLVAGFFGYRYVAPAKQIESIAVMPFVNESGNADVEYLSDGMTETLISSLTQLPNLNVKARSSVFRYKGKETDLKTIGKELSVQAILNGRVIQRGEQLTINLELVDVATENAIWSQRYERKQSELVALQSEIAKDVSTKLTAKLSGADEAKVTKTSTSNPEAYQAYLKGRYYWNRRSLENLQKAIEQFKIAADHDPNYALAYAGLADCYVLVNFYTGAPPGESRQLAKTYAERALALDDQLGEPHATLGLLYSQSWQWSDAEPEYKRAIELNPNYATAYHWYSIFLRSRGHFDEAALMIKRAQEIDPLSSIIGVNVSLNYQLLNDHNASIENTRKIIEIDPGFPSAYDALGLSYLKLERYAEAIENLEKAVELSNRESNVLSSLGYGYALAGKRTDSVAIAKELEEKFERKESSARNIAAVYAGLGDKDKAFEWLEKGFEDKGNLWWISFEIPFESLRPDPRFKDLLKRMNLPE